MRRAILCALLAVSCTKSEPEVKKVDAEYVTPKSTAAQAPPSAVPSSSAPEPPASPMPSESEWAAALARDRSSLDVKERISSSGGCEATKVREWVRILCKPGVEYPWAGDPLAIRVEKGQKSVDSGQSQLQPRADGSVSLVYRFVEGTDVHATFEMSATTFTLRSTFPGHVYTDGAYKGVREVGTFDIDDDKAAIKECTDRIPEGHDFETRTLLESECAQREEERRKERVTCHRDCMKETSKPLVSCMKICSGAEAAPPVKPVVEQVALPVEPAIDGAPSLEAWSSAKEIGVRGSDAHGCETKQLRDFIRVVCRPNAVTGKVLSASWESGTDKAASYAVAGEGAAILLTRYVEGTAAKAVMRWERTAATLVLEWPQGKKEPPSIRGSITKS